MSCIIIDMVALALLLSMGYAQVPDSAPVDAFPGEKHLKNVRQLTFGGQNAEAYWSPDCKQLIYQTAQPEYPDEQIIIMNADGSNKHLVSTGKGRCTCSYFAPDGKTVYFSSTHERNPGPQAPVDKSKGYVWMVNPDFALYRAKPDGSELTPIIKKDGYVAETTIAPNGKYMVFTSTFEGDLEIYRANLDGSHIKRLTNEIGYDGGPFVSWDSKLVAYRRQAVHNDAEKKDYLDLLHQNLVRPGKLEIWVMDPNGNHKRQVTNLGGASFAPFIHPVGKRVIFSTNFADPKGREFDIYMCNLDGTHLERITTSPGFDGFPMFSRDGKKVVFASNRYAKQPHDTNLFVADWVE